ncbi:MAG: 2-oxo acid dehydrogenase subunit E2 [Deltaproteobacteria bacterium]|nr:2-oxo acid dehydrogenase subunit E2 [Deltaproteobacteria bacterium]
MFRRTDGRLAKVAPYRRMMPFLMKGRNESAVLFEQTVDLSRALPWLAAWNARPDRAGKATVFHLVLHALASLLHERPRLNRFVAGSRVYDREGVWLSFAAKKQMHDDAPIATIKRAFPADESFAAMVAAMTSDIGEARTDRPSTIDRELAILLRLPRPLLGAAVALLHRLDAVGLAPKALTASDPMYASAFVANLGSLKIDAAYHHLFEHGNCPLFATIGQIAPRPFAKDDGTVELRPALILRYTYDERIEDGFYCAQSLAILQRHLEEPAGWIA